MLCTDASRQLDVLRITFSHPFLLTDANTLYRHVRYTTPGPSFVCLLCDHAKRFHMIVRDLESTNLSPEYRAQITVHTYAEDDPIVALVQLMRECVFVGVEHSPRFSHAQFASLRNALGARVMWQDVTRVMLCMRYVKSDEEVAAAAAAARYVAAGYTQALRNLEPGMCETDVAAHMALGIRRAGSEWTAYPEFVAAGTNGLCGHHPASRKRLEEGEVLFMELGACHDRVHAARMHTLYHGTALPAWYVCAEAVMRGALAHAASLCVPGARCKDVYDQVNCLVHAGLDADVTPRLPTGCQRVRLQRRVGYSIGLGNDVDWCDAGLFVDPSSEERLAAGNVLHLIPWIQIEGVGAMGFSDVVLVGANSGATSLFDRPQPAHAETSVFCLDRRSTRTSSAQERLVMPSNVSVAAATPLVRVADKGSPLHHVYLKDERARDGARSYKVLGVTRAVDALLDDGTLVRGTSTVSTMSDGNHGECLAMVARKRGLKCVVFLPDNVSDERVTAIAALGADVRRLVGCDYDECIAAVRCESKRHGWIVVADTSWAGYTRVPRWIATGYATLFHEALAQMAPHAPTHCFVQAGVGTLLQSACNALPSTTTLICVESVDAACIYENLTCDRSAATLRPCVGTTNSIMQGLNCATPSIDAYETIRGRVDACVAIGDEHARRAVQRLHTAHCIDCSPSGAAGVAGLCGLTSEARRNLGLDLADTRVLIVLTEGVTDVTQFNALI